MEKKLEKLEAAGWLRKMMMELIEQFRFEQDEEKEKDLIKRCRALEYAIKEIERGN